MIRREGGIPLPPPVALARAVDSLDDVPVTDPVFEPKWDGWRAVVAGGRVWSRRGTDLTRYLPDLAPVLGARLPADVVIDGELVAWDAKTGRLDFPGLQARLTAGPRIAAVAKRHPVQLVAFDLLAAAGTDLRGQPLAERRGRLEVLLSGVGPPLSLCQQTQARPLATDWFTTLTAGGIEGLVIKSSGSVYPTVPGQRPWWKVKARSAVDLVVVGVIGDLAAPSALVLARPGGVRSVAVTTVLSRLVARRLWPLLTTTGETWQRTMVWGTSDTVTVQAVEPVVAEVSADVAVDDGGVFRHPVRLLRVRPDLTPQDLID